MTRHASVPLLSVAAALVMSVTAAAHHSGAMFERDKTITVEGTV